MSNSNLLPKEAQNYFKPFSQVWTCEEKELANRIRAVQFCISLPLSIKKQDREMMRLVHSLPFFSASLNILGRHAIEDTVWLSQQELPELCCRFRIRFIHVAFVYYCLLRYYDTIDNVTTSKCLCEVLTDSKVPCPC